MNPATKIKLSSPQERLDLILMGLARQQPIKGLCRQAGVSRELFYRWMRAVREVGLKALEAKSPGPKLIEAEKAPKEVLRLRERVARLEKENKALREEGSHWKLLGETAKRIIRRQGWGPVPEPGSKKNAMRSPKREGSMPRSGAESAPPEPRSRLLPGAGGSAEARTGDGQADAGAPPGAGL